MKTTKWLADQIGQFIDSRGPGGATARDVWQYCKPGGAPLSQSQVRRGMEYLWINGWTPAGKHHRVTRTRLGDGSASRYVMGTHATRQQIDDARLSRLLLGITHTERDARQADIILEGNPMDWQAQMDRSNSLSARHSYCSGLRALLSRNPQYVARLAARPSVTPGRTLLDDVNAS